MLVFVDQLPYECRVQVSPDLHDDSVREAGYPAVPVVEGLPVQRCGKRFQFHRRGVTIHQQVGNAQDYTLLEELVQPAEGVCEEVSLCMVGAGQRMGAHHGPVDVLRHVVEESITSSVLQVGEETSNIAGLDRHSAPLLVDAQVFIQP